MKFYAVIAGLLLLATNAYGQVKCDGYGKGTIAGTPLSYDCGTAPAPTPIPVPTPPPPLNPGVCDASQTSYNGLARQCTGYVSYKRSIPPYSMSGALTSADTLFLGTWGSYKLSGNPFTIMVNSGQYVSFALTAKDALHGLRLDANQTWGIGGSLWASATPGGAPLSQMCGSSGDPHLQLYPFPGTSWCAIPVGVPIFLNWSDGQPVAYTVY